MTTGFWDSIVKDFGLDLGQLTDLPVPPEDELFDCPRDDQLESIVKKVIGDNPCDKYPALKILEKRLATSPKLLLSQVYALLVASQEGEHLRKPMSMRMQWSILSMWCKYDYDSVWPAAWPAMSKRMSEIVLDHWHARGKF